MTSSSSDQGHRLAEILAEMISAALDWDAQHAEYLPGLDILSDGLTDTCQPVHNGATDDSRDLGGWDGSNADI